MTLRSKTAKSPNDDNVIKQCIS